MGIQEVGPGSADQMFSMLRAGMEQGLKFVETTFQAYTRCILPVDKFIFWQPTTPLIVKGSLHYSQEMLQNEDETFGQAMVIFTADSRITEFENRPVNTIYVLKVAGFRVAFAQQQGFYEEAGIWHYFGHSLPPAMTSQLLDNPASIDPSQAVVSNSLPLWLALNNYQCPYYDGFSNSITLMPSYIVDQNEVPPYGAVHIGEEDTSSPQATAYLSANRSHSQLCFDTVKITLYGLQNKAALSFVDCVNQFSLDTNYFGIRNIPVISDAKRTLPELQAIGMKKTVTFEISYHQWYADTVARQLIKQATVEYTFQGGYKPPNPPINVLGTDTGAPIVTDSGQPIQVT